MISELGQLPHKNVPARSELICQVRYCNNLPDIPFDCKYICYPFEQKRSVKYELMPLEKQHKFELLTEPDLGVPIDLINRDTSRTALCVPLNPIDDMLLEEEIQAPSISKRSKLHAKVVPWMRKTEYISTEYNGFSISNEKPEVKIGKSVKLKYSKEIYKDRFSQITAIEMTFVDAQNISTEHYRKPNVTSVEVLPVFPDFKMWMNPCAQVTFDSDPTPKEFTGSTALTLMSQAMIRGMASEDEKQFVAYFLPEEETIRKRKRDVETGLNYMANDTYDYKMARTYNWNLKNKASKGYKENYFFIFREGGVYYNVLDTRVLLSKFRAKAETRTRADTFLIVKHREMNEEELEDQEAHKAQLGNHEEEEEEMGSDHDEFCLKSI